MGTSDVNHTELHVREADKTLNHILLHIIFIAIKAWFHAFQTTY
jgi:hypothetical protein